MVEAKLLDNAEFKVAAFQSDTWTQTDAPLPDSRINNALFLLP